MLTYKQSRFAFEYAADGNGTKAAIRAGYSERSAHDSASRLLSNPEVQEAIKEREESLAAAASIDVRTVLREYLDVATADPTEIMRLVVQPCRLCWPAGLTIDEPNPLCSQPIMVEGSNVGGCGGRGYQAVHLTDWRKLSPKARKLIKRIKETKNGIEIELKDQEHHWDLIAKHLGMFPDKKELSGPGGGPIPLAAVSEIDLTDEQLAAIAAMALTDGGTNALREGTSEGTPRLLDGNSSDIS